MKIYDREADITAALMLDHDSVEIQRIQSNMEVLAVLDGKVCVVVYHFDDNLNNTGKTIRRATEEELQYVHNKRAEEKRAAERKAAREKQ